MAVEKILEEVKTQGGRKQRSKQVCIMVLLEAHNAFNSVSWQNVLVTIKTEKISS